MLTKETLEWRDNTSTFYTSVFEKLTAAQSDEKQYM